MFFKPMGWQTCEEAFDGCERGHPGLANFICAAFLPEELHASCSASALRQTMTAGPPICLNNRLGFLTRLDGPCTGLVFLATDLSGLLVLSSQVRLYRIARCYAVGGVSAMTVMAESALVGICPWLVDYARLW